MTDRQINLIESIKSSLVHNNLSFKNDESIYKEFKGYYFKNDGEIILTIDTGDLKGKYIITALDKVKIYDEDLLVEINGLILSVGRSKYLSLRIRGDFNITIKNIVKDVYVRL